ncbi:putative membrane protein [Micromonospora pisi]|uniref:Putative membrane protein n=1 Tax=Micromonospora pisi TaxID=589240 RepID=A0A495JML8_9ACTN|nr:putative membrane protein [Micromonospora pisi]
MRTDAPKAPTGRGRRGRSTAATVLIGVGVMAAVDEIVFHQLLRWHHFYDRSTPALGLVSDGLLHAAELVALVAGFFLLADLRRHGWLVPASAWAGLFLGLGGFQLFDGVVDHKVLRVHQIRYGVEIVPYDVAWIASGALLLVVGALLALRTRRPSDAR